MNRISKVMLALTVAMAGLAAMGCQKTSLQLRQDAREARIADDYVRAADLYRASIDRNPSNFMGYYWLGICQLELDQPIDAQLNLERAWTLEPDDAEWTPRILNALARSLAAQGPEAEPALFAFLNRQAQQYQTSDAFLRQGKYLAAAGDADNAHLAFAKAIQFADGKSPKPYMEAARFYLDRQDKVKAVEALRYANYVDPDNAKVAAMFREAGVVPGPSQVAVPPRDKP